MLINDVKRYLEGVITGLMDKYSTSFTSNEISTPAFTADDEEVHVPTVDSSDNSTKAASTAYVNSVVQSSGGGDMLRSVYDSDEDGIIDVPQGGTGGSTAAQARTNIGAASQDELNTVINTLNNKYPNTEGNIAAHAFFLDKSNLQINVDTINNEYGYIYRVSTSSGGTHPLSIVNSNDYLLIGYSRVINNDPDRVAYGVQIAIGSGDSKIAIRYAGYFPSGNPWNPWVAV